LPARPVSARTCWWTRCSIGNWVWAPARIASRCWGRGMR